MIKSSPRSPSLVPAIGALAGLLIGYAVASRLRSSPAVGQLPGFALANGFSPRTSVLRVANMAPGDTWLDFGNAPGLYYLFDRDCPIRYYEPGFYESDSAQREVIAAVDANPRVRAVLMAGPFDVIDGLSNSKRAPLVAEFIRERFRRFYREGDVEFWIRRSPQAAGGVGGAVTAVERPGSSVATRP